MARARRGMGTAPFARARAEGFLFESAAMHRAIDALWDAADGGRFPIVLTGPTGAGKTTLLLKWAEQARSQGWLAVPLDANALTPGAVADQVLAAFGQRPVDGASAEQALEDYLDDCRLEDLGLAVLVADLDAVPASAIRELARLAGPPPSGGLGLALVATTSVPEAIDPFLAGERVALGAMTPDETGRFLVAALDAAGAEDVDLGEGFADAVHAASGGLVGEAGALLDEAVARSAREGSARLAVRHIAARSGGPTPREIERSLLALAEEAERRGADQRGLRRGRGSSAFPTIEVGRPSLPEGAPANDLKVRFGPDLVEALEALASDIIALEDQLELIRVEAEALETASHDRVVHLKKAGDRFVTSLRNRPDRGDRE